MRRRLYLALIATICVAVVMGHDKVDQKKGFFGSFRLSPRSPLRAIENSFSKMLAGMGGRGAPPPSSLFGKAFPWHSSSESTTTPTTITSTSTSIKTTTTSTPTSSTSTVSMLPGDSSDSNNNRSTLKVSKGSSQSVPSKDGQSLGFSITSTNGMSDVPLTNFTSTKDNNTRTVSSQTSSDAGSTTSIEINKSVDEENEKKSTSGKNSVGFDLDALFGDDEDEDESGSDATESDTDEDEDDNEDDDDDDVVDEDDDVDGLTNLELLQNDGETSIELTPSFDPSITEYTATTESRYIRIRATFSGKAAAKLSDGDANLLTSGLPTTARNDDFEMSCHSDSDDDSGGSGSGDSDNHLYIQHSELGTFTIVVKRTCECVPIELNGCVGHGENEGESCKPTYSTQAFEIPYNYDFTLKQKENLCPAHVVTTITLDGVQIYEAASNTEEFEDNENPFEFVGLQKKEFELTVELVVNEVEEEGDGIYECEETGKSDWTLIGVCKT